MREFNCFVIDDKGDIAYNWKRTDIAGIFWGNAGDVREGGSGMAQSNGRKTTTDITFGKVACTEPRKVGTQDVERTAASWEMVEDCLWDMFEDKDQFVVLTVADARCGVRYVQAAQIEGGIIVQLGLEEGDHIRLVERQYSEAECLRIFQEFYQSSKVRHIEKYTPVEFFV